MANKFGCCTRLSSSETLKCKECKLKYHFSCTHQHGYFKETSEEYKNNWECPSCRSKRPKFDNTNTPLRENSFGVTKKDKSPSNITYRTNRPRIQSDDPGDNSSANNDIRKVVKEEISSTIGELQSTLIALFNNKTKELASKIDEISTSIIFFEQKYEDLKKEMETKITALSKLEVENQQLKTTVADLSSRLSQTEQHSRSCNVEIQCLPEKKSENLVIAIKKISETVGFKFNDTDLHLCTRISKIDKTSSRPRSILAKFGSPRIRDGFLASVLSFNKKAKQKDDKLNTSHLGIAGDKKPIFVVEHLSPGVKKLHALARQTAQLKHYKFVWIKSGRIYMRKTETSDYKLIKNKESLDGLD